jgi:hypothetical protein
LTIDGYNNSGLSGGVFQVDQTASGTTFSDLTISRGNVWLIAAAIDAKGSVTVTNCNFWKRPADC